jgi:hypothetical protein
MIRADTIRHTANPGKDARVMAFVGPYRDCCAAIAAKESRVFNETGKFGAKPSATTGPQQSRGTYLFCVPYVSTVIFMGGEAPSGTQQNLLFSVI